MSRPTTYVREEEDEVDSEDVIVGAYLRAARTFQDVPTLHVTTNIDDLLKHDAKDVVYGHEEQIETEIHKRHPIEGEGLTYVLTPAMRKADGGVGGGAGITCSATPPGPHPSP